MASGGCDLTVTDDPDRRLYAASNHHHRETHTSVLPLPTTTPTPPPSPPPPRNDNVSIDADAASSSHIDDDHDDVGTNNKINCSNNNNDDDNSINSNKSSSSSSSRSNDNHQIINMAQMGTTDLSVALDFRDRSSTIGSFGDLGFLGIFAPHSPTGSAPAHITCGGEDRPYSTATEATAATSATTTTTLSAVTSSTTTTYGLPPLGRLGALGAALEAHHPGGVGELLTPTPTPPPPPMGSGASPRMVLSLTPGSTGSPGGVAGLAQTKHHDPNCNAFATLPQNHRHHSVSLGPTATATATVASASQQLGRPLPFPGMCHINHAAKAGAAMSSSSSSSPLPSGACELHAASGGDAGAGAEPARHSRFGSDSQPSSNGSASGFFSGNFGMGGTSGGGGGGSGSGSGGMVAHTPPSAMGPASYEARHFGKRMRAGSISGRLRSASDAGQALEDLGLIDRAQRGVMKDLIIAGDDALQSALDRYEEGDCSALEAMIRSGKLQSNSSVDIDVLGDLDLDFLTVGDGDDDDGDFGRLGMGSNAGSDAHGALGHACATKSMPIPITSGQRQHGREVQSEYDGGENASHMRSSTPYADDGIGELEFNGEYSGAATEEELHLPNGPYGAHSVPMAVRSQQIAQTDVGGPSPSMSISEGRFRANSLAFGSLLNEPPPQQSYGKWMDRHPVGSDADQGTGRNVPEVVSSSSSNVIGVNGGLYVLPGGAQQMSPLASAAAVDVDVDVRSNRPVGEATSPADDSSNISIAEKTEDEIKCTTSTVQRLDQAAERRREKQHKKEQREKEKKERKERKERETERKEKDQREKQERREKKEAVAKTKQEKKKEKRNSSFAKIGGEIAKDEECGSDDEQREVVSGTGRPRSLSDPNLSVGIDNDGLLQIDNPDGWVGAYSPDSRKMRIERFLEKRNHRVWTKKVKYDVRKNFADSRLRVKGRFVKKEDELLMRDLMSLT